MGIYDTEQGPDFADPGVTRLDTDLIPWLRDEWGTDVVLDEFPYHQYAGADFPPEDDEKTRDWLEMDWTDDDPMKWTDEVARKGPYRTDLVAVRVDRRALRTRIQRLGHHTPMNQPQQGKRRYRRTYLSFLGDGPMRRSYWESEHGGKDELPGYGEASASRAFGWLKKRGFLANVGGEAWDAVKLPLHVHGGVHAIELKVETGEWDTALEQAARADVFADYRWVAMGRDVADRALANRERFQSEGVGLLTVHPEHGVEVCVWPEQSTPVVDRELLNRYMVERWDVSERVLSKLELRYDKEQDPEQDPEQWAPGVPDILGQIEREGLETEPEPPTVHGHTAATETTADAADSTGKHRTLTEFGNDCAKN